VPERITRALQTWWTLAASLVLCAGLWYWAVVIFAPANTASAQQRHRPMGNNSDLYARWHGTRELLLHHRDPYSRDITREVQAGFYGRPLESQNVSDPKAQEGFNYPLYAVFLFAPFAGLSFATAQAIFRWLLILAASCTVPLWMKALGFRPRLPLMLAGIVLTAGAYPSVMEFYQQNLAALVIFLLAAAIASIARGWHTLAGFLLALSTIKPEIAGLMVFWSLLWAAGHWRKRYALIASFSATLAALIVAAEIALPHWVGRFLGAIREYQVSDADLPITEVLLPRFVGRLTTFGLICLLIVLLWRWKGTEEGSETFKLGIAWVAAVTLAVLPKLAAYNQLLLVPALMVLLGRWQDILHGGLITRSIAKAALASQVWQWIAALGLAVCSIAISPRLARSAAQAPLYTLLALPPLVLAAVAFLTVSHRFASRPDPAQP
jgi:Glycosyltransferase family 87